MKRLFTVLLTLVFMLSLTAGPVMAKGGNGGGGSNGGGNGSGKSSSTISSSAKADHGSKSVKDNTGSANVKGDSGRKSAGNSNKKSNNENKSGTNAGASKIKNSNTSALSGYSDTSGHWASKSIRTMKSLGVINGYEDGSFKPDSPVTGIEAVVMMVKMTELLGSEQQTTGEESNGDETAGEETNTEESVDDNTGDEESGEETVSSEVPAWAKESFNQAGAKGIINLNRFHSRVQASRVECAVMLARALNLELNPDLNENELPLSDVGYLSGEDLGYLLALQQSGIIHGSPDGKFNPNSSITRGEIAAMLAAVVQADEDDGTSGDASGDNTGTEDTTADGTGTDATTIDGTTTD